VAYETFKRTGIRVGTPTVAITTDGRMAINAAAVRIIVGAGVKFVLLRWDKDRLKVAIKATHKGDKNAYAISVAPDGHAGTLRAKSFLNHIGWNAPERETLSATWNEQEKMFEITLPTAHVAQHDSEAIRSIITHPTTLLAEEDLTSDEERKVELYLLGTRLGTVALTVEELFKAFAIENSVRSPRKTREFMESFFSRKRNSVKQERRPTGEIAYLWKRGS
jgi:hypothetical protein